MGSGGTEESGEEGAARGLHVEDERRPLRKRDLQPADAAGGCWLGRGGRRRRERGGLEQLDDEGRSCETDGGERDAILGAGLRGGGDGDTLETGVIRWKGGLEDISGPALTAFRDPL